MRECGLPAQMMTPESLAQINSLILYDAHAFDGSSKIPQQ